MGSPLERGKGCVRPYAIEHIPAIIHSNHIPLKRKFVMGGKGWRLCVSEQIDYFHHRNINLIKT